MSKSRSVPGWALPVGLGVVVVALVAIALLRGPLELDVDTPEGTVQAYLVALDEKRWDDAVEIIHPQWRGKCTGESIQTFFVDDFTADLDDGSNRGEFFPEATAEFEADVGDLPGGTEFVGVVIHHSDQFGSSWDEPVQFELLDDDDFWWIVGQPWPYFIWECRGF